MKVKQSKKKHFDDHLNSGCDEHTGAYNCVPGGAHLTNDDDCCFSSTCVVEISGSYYMMTTSHSYKGCSDTDCNSDLSGLSTYQGKSSEEYLGDIYTYHHGYDFALVEESGVNKKGLSNTIVNESGKDVEGSVTSKKCDELISSYDTTKHQGVSTGKTWGYLDEKVTHDWCNSTVDKLKLTPEAGAGDSGGPHYWVNDAGPCLDA